MQLVRIEIPNWLTNSFLNLHIWKFKRLNISGTEYMPTENPWAGFQNFTSYFMYLILA